MAAAAVMGLSVGKRLLSTSFYPSDLADKMLPAFDHSSTQISSVSTKSSSIVVKNNFGPHIPPDRNMHAIKALKENVDVDISVHMNTDTRVPRTDHMEDESYHLDESSLEVLILLQKSMLEKQWKLSCDQMRTIAAPSETCKNKKEVVACSGVSARQRRIKNRRNNNNQSACAVPLEEGRSLRSVVSSELLQARPRGYVRGTVSQDLLTHAEVVQLSKKIKVGISLEEHRSKLEKKLGYEPSEKQLAWSLRMSHAELRSKMIECSFAREKLAMSNVRLVMSVAQKYDNLGAEMADLVQGGLIGLLRGIEKFDSTKGFKISTYVYWWIRQGVSRALLQNCTTLRIPKHLHERLSLVRNAKIRLEDKGITPSIDKIAVSLNMSQQKVRNATEAVNKVISLDREVFPSLNGLPSETFHSFIADNNLDNNPWNGFEEWSLKDEVNKLLSTSLGEREGDIIRLYYGLNAESKTWEDISKQYGLSRERVRQVGLVAMEKLKKAARKKRLEAMLVKH